MIKITSTPCPHNCGAVTSDVYLLGDITNPEDYIEVVELLRGASDLDVINIHLNTDGGSLDTADMLYNVISSSKALTTACLYGLVASAGTIIALATDVLTVSKGVKFLIHKPYTPEQSADVQTERQWKAANTLLYNDVFSRLLSAGELAEVAAGGEILLTRSDIARRVDNGGSGYVRN